MTLDEVIAHIFSEYGTEPDCPFPGDGRSAVFRHADNRKWFAITMTVPRRALGMPGDGQADVLNVKCDPVIIGSLRGKPGFLPAYHMIRDNWVSILLDGSAEAEDIAPLLALSWELTRTKDRRKNDY